MNAFRPLAVAAALAAFCTPASAQFEGMKGKMKEGLYDYKMEMDMGNIPGMPPGMSKQAHSFQQCITAKDIEKGGFQRGKEGKMPENCEVRDFKMSGNTASYTWECKGERPMKADNKMTFLDNGFDMDMNMSMTQRGQVMNMKQKMQARHVGPCQK